MTHNLPVEILQVIFRHAISQEEKDIFTPLPYDYTRIQGVVEASPKLAEIVHSIPTDVVYVDTLGPELGNYSSGPAWYALYKWKVHTLNFRSSLGMFMSTLTQAIKLLNWSRF